MQGHKDRNIAIDDCRFHQCVRLSTWGDERTITFVPPDGEFELMTYRITENVQSPFRVFPSIKECGTNKSRVEVAVTVKSGFPRTTPGARNVVVKIPVPRNTAKAEITDCFYGKAKLEPTQAMIVWKIKKFPGETEYRLKADAELASTVADRDWVRPPIERVSGGYVGFFRPASPHAEGAGEVQLHRGQVDPVHHPGWLVPVSHLGLRLVRE